jgi:polar amino acid transport system substrate-binding protein
MNHIGLKNKRLMTGLATAFVAVFALSACATESAPPAVDSGGSETEAPTTSASNTLELAIQTGFIRVAIANEPPYTSVSAGGDVSGAEPDVARAVFKLMGVEDIQGIVTPYAAMIPGLQAGRWDVITAGLFMKRERCEQVAYSEPVVVSTESYAVPLGNPDNILSVADVVNNPSFKIAVLPGGFEEGLLLQNGVPDSQLVFIQDGRSGMEAVESGRANAFMLPTLSLDAIVADHPTLEVTPFIQDAPITGGGAAFRLEDSDLRDQYNAVLAEFRQTQEFRDILTGWGFDPEAAAAVTTAQLCAQD